MGYQALLGQTRASAAHKQRAMGHLALLGQTGASAAHKKAAGMDPPRRTAHDTVGTGTGVSGADEGGTAYRRMHKIPCL
jgi:hypothetical protein